jgi:hypothetical protein
MAQACSYVKVMLNVFVLLYFAESAAVVVVLVIHTLLPVVLLCGLFN